MSAKTRLAIAVIALISIFSASCSNEQSVDIRETGQQIADSMASIDESAGSTGNFAMIQSAGRTFARLSPSDVNEAWLNQLLMPSAYAATCYGNGFGGCSGGIRTRTFGGCTIGSATVSGTVTLTFSGTGTGTCTIPANGDTVTRVPNFTVTGLRGATLSVTGAAGQVVSRTNALAGASATFSFSNTTGIRRIFNTTSATLFDFTTTTTSNVTITGTTRGSRSVSGGTIVVTNNISSSTYSTCTYTPVSVTWGSSSCNCPTSGSWTGTCIKRSDSSSVGTTLTFNSCGVATFIMGTESEQFTLDRCASS